MPVCQCEGIAADCIHVLILSHFHDVNVNVCYETVCGGKNVDKTDYMLKKNWTKEKRALFNMSAGQCANEL